MFLFSGITVIMVMEVEHLVNRVYTSVPIVVVSI
jgi:hypothetical protein